MRSLYLKIWRKTAATLMCLVLTSPVFATTTGDLPFVKTMDTLKEAIRGPFLLSASIIMIVVTCIMLAFGEWGDGFKKMINIALYLSIAFAATTFISSLFVGGAVF